MRHLFDPRPRRALLATVAMAATAAVMSACGAHIPGAQANTGATASARAARAGLTVTVTQRAVGAPVPSGFVGLSVEYRNLLTYVGTDPAALSAPFLQLVRNLAPGQRPVLRIGGDSTDWTWSPVPGMAPPGGVRFAVTPGYLAVVRAVATAVHARLIMGVNLEADNRTVARDEAQALLRGIGAGSIEALELGNEPNLYGALPWYKNSAGVHVLGRPRGYGFPQYMHDFSTISRAMPAFPLAGPSAGAPELIDPLNAYLSAQRKVRLVTVHAYPLKHCTRATHITSSQLLASAASNGLAASLAPQIAVAHRHHLPIRIDEMNGISCGGTRGVSNTFTSALWAVDALFALARAGVDGVNMHTVPGTINEVIGARRVNGQWQAIVHPQYYGMMMFAQAAPAGARLLHVVAPAGPVKAWATRGLDHHVRTVLINRQSRRVTVLVRVASSGTPPTLERLTAPGVHATGGVRLGGQSFGAATTTGQPAGTPSSGGATPVRGGYLVTLPGYSAGLLTS